jgi:RNA polymerase sigma factor (sigma-70 family)
VVPTDEDAPRAPGSRDPVLERAFERLWERYYRRLWAFVRSYAALSSEEAEDAVQEIMWRAYRALPEYDRARSAAPWIFRIARNHCIDRMRSLGRPGEGSAVHGTLGSHRPQHSLPRIL